VLCLVRANRSSTAIEAARFVEDIAWEHQSPPLQTDCTCEIELSFVVRRKTSLDSETLGISPIKSRNREIYLCEGAGSERFQSEFLTESTRFLRDFQKISEVSLDFRMRVDCKLQCNERAIGLDSMIG
jgi:hypothetical protein